LTDLKTSVYKLILSPDGNFLFTAGKGGKNRKWIIQFETYNF